MGGASSATRRRLLEKLNEVGWCALKHRQRRWVVWVIRLSWSGMVTSRGKCMSGEVRECRHAAVKTFGRLLGGVTRGS